MTMQNPQTCLSAELLRQLSHDELSPAQLKDVEVHVSDCERCRQLLEVPQSDSQWQDEIVPILRTPLESPHVAGDHDERGCEGESLESILRLLGPTDDPHMLGRIGSYEVVGVIGRGGMGVVFKAYEGALNRFVAIKMLLPHLAASGAARKRFAREGKAAAAVIDDNVMPIYSVAEWQGVPYLVTQHSRGATLEKRIRDQGPLELKEILRIGMQTARGLAAAHAQGLVHRDVKPSNILLDGTVERALLTDFGLARAVDDSSITRTGIIAGTPQYMSPEQARGGSVDARSDLFGLGCVLYAMCTGRPPFRAESSYAILRMITDDEPRSIREINPDIPEWLCLLISRLMAKSPDARFGNALEVAALLEQCLAHVQQPTSVPLPASLVSHATGRRSIFNVTRKGMITMIGTIGMTLLGMVLWQATEAPDISGQWTSDEWGIVVLDAKGPGQYEGTIAAPVKGQSAEGEDSGSSAGTTLGGSSGVLPGTDSSFGSGSVTTPAGTDGVLPGSSGSLPGSSGSGFPGTDISRGSSAATTLEGSSSVLPGSPGLADPGKGKSGTLQLKWSRVERRFNGTWGKGENRNGRMSLRLVGNEIRGAWTTNKEALEESGTPRLGDLLWTRNAPKSQPAESPPEAHAATVKRNADEDHGLFATNLIFTPPSMMPEGHIRSQDFGTSSVTLNLGSTQDVKVGYVFHVFRPTDDGNGVKGVIGAIRITDVQRTTSTANVLSMQFVDKFKDTDRVRRPMFYTHESGKVHISVTLTKEQRAQYASLERTFAPLRALIGSKGLIAIDGGDYQDCRVSIHPPTKYDPEFVQSIADYLQTQKVISFAQVTVVRQSGADAFEGADSAGTLGSHGRTEELAGTANASTSNVLNPKSINMPPQAADGTRSVVTVPDGGNVLLGGQPTTNRAEATLPVPQPVLSNVTLAERSATVIGVGADDLDCVLRIAKSKRNEQLEWTTSVNGHFSATVTATTDRLPSDDGQLIRGIVLTIQDSKKSSTTSIDMSDGDPVPAGAVKFRQVSAMDRADTMMTFADIHCDDGTTIPISILLRSNKQHNKIAIDEAFRAHKVPNVRWLDASGNQLDGPIPTVPAQPPTPANTDDSALSVVDETLKSLIESLKPLQGDWAVELPGTQFYVVELPGTQFYPADKLGDSAVSHFVMRIRTNHVELRPFPHSGEQPVSKLLLHPIQDAKPGHFLVDTDPSAVDQRFSPGEFSFEVQDNQLHVKLIPAKSSESNRPNQGSEAPKGFSVRRETEGFSARRATDEEQRKFAQDRLQHMRMVGYKNADRTNPEAVVEAYVAASLAGDVAIATSLAEGSAARPDQSTGWNKHWNLNDFAIKSVRVRGQVVTPMRVTAKEAIVVSELMHRTSPATIGDVSVGHHVTFLKNINGKWVVSAFDLWTAEHYNKGIGNFLNADGEAIGVP